MPRLGRSRYLSCFYCSRRTSEIFDGKTRQFDCPFCEATNYLDEDGQITDPPVATDKEATPTKYVVSRTTMSSPSSTSVPFCAKCLKNQHLLRTSLAQYLPDPDDPEYEQLWKDYRRFRDNQERIYPQICADCEPKVRRALDQAAYTAKTDALRRLIERGNKNRKQVIRRGWLDIFDATGKWLWMAGLVLQLGWHISVLKTLYPQSGELVGAFGISRFIPAAERLMRWSILSSVLSAWWNPRFMQVFRGFTKHISGISRWYFYQFVAVIMRAMLQQSTFISNPDPSLLHTQLAAHLFAVGFAVLIFTLGPRSIRTDNTRLFEPTCRPLLQPVDTPKPRPKPRPDDTKSITELLDEISSSPPSNLPHDEPPSPISDDHFLPPRPNPRLTRTAQQRSSDLDLDGLNLSSHPRPTYYDTEMDWSPTQSKHRAFNNLGQRPAKTGTGFNEAPTEPLRGAFWYKVPPAPTTPAQRIFNPPNQPRLRKSPVAVSPNEKVGFSPAVRGDGDDAAGIREAISGDSRSGVDFRQPRFFPPARGNDPRDSLSGLLGEGLSLSQEEREREKEKRSWWGGFMSGKKG